MGHATRVDGLRCSILTAYMAAEQERTGAGHQGRLPPALSEQIPTRFTQAGAMRFWIAAVLTGVATGIGAIALTRLLELVQHWLWPGPSLLQAAAAASAQRHSFTLLGAGVVVIVGQLLLRQLTSGNGIDTTAAIWFHAGRMPALRTLGSAVLSVLIVGMGVSLGREGAPKQAGAVFANFFADRVRLSEEQRRLLVACGAGAGMGAAYGVPLGGAIFSLEVMRGVLALRYVLPAILVLCRGHLNFVARFAECKNPATKCRTTPRPPWLACLPWWPGRSLA